MNKDPYGLQSKPISDLQARLIAAAERIDGETFVGNEYHAALLRESDRRLTALIELQNRPEPTAEDINFQKWNGMDGATAFHLIERHAENWSHIDRLMEAWRKENST